MPQLLLNAIAGYAVLNSGKGKLGWLGQKHYGHTSLYVPLPGVLLVVVEGSSPFFGCLIASFPGTHVKLAWVQLDWAPIFTPTT